VSARRGFALIELLIAIAILAFVTMLLFGAFSGMRASREGLQRVNDRYREGRTAMARITRDLESAYVSQHVPIDLSIQAVKTGFKGTRGTPADRLDFNSFSNQRLDKDARESDQAEISYFGSPDPDRDGVTDLARRISPQLDLDFDRGGRVDVLATDIDLFEVEYLDALTGQWTETWDTTQSTAQPDRLPLQVRVVLVLNGGARKASGMAREPVRFVSKIAIPIRKPLTFATQ
jgi:general secretion pathway protein J